MRFQKIDFQTWERTKGFRFFMNNLRNVISITVDLDVTVFLRRVNARGQKFYPSMLWAVSRVVNAHEEFRVGRNAEGEYGIYDFVSPYYAQFYRQDEKFAKLVTEYSPDEAEFCKRFSEDAVRYQDLRGFDFAAPPNVFDVSCLPWTHYRAFDVHVFDEGDYLAPVITWGKFEEHGGKMILPFSFNIHHAVADGFHVCRFLNELQELLNQ